MTPTTWDDDARRDWLREDESDSYSAWRRASELEEEGDIAGALEALREDELDVRIENHGSLFLFYPLTSEARLWIENNIGEEAQFWCGGLVVEPRYVQSIMEGMSVEGGLRL